MKIHYDIIQGTPEWRRLRAGKLTASNAQAIATAGKGLETLIYETLAEKHSSGEYSDYTNEDMERGKELEDMARQMYELETGNKVTQAGFIELDEYTGCSPDGLVGEAGMIEIKCRKDSVYLRALIEGLIDIKAKWQVQMALLVSGRKWIDYIEYNPNFVKSMNITRIYPDAEMRIKLEEGITEGKKLLAEAEKKYKKLIK